MIKSAESIKLLGTSHPRNGHISSVLSSPYLLHLFISGISLECLATIMTHTIMADFYHSYLVPFSSALVLALLMVVCNNVS